jgi:hypothetical protein
LSVRFDRCGDIISTPCRFSDSSNASLSYAVADQVLRLRLYHVEIETQLHQGYFMMARRMRTHLQRQAAAIDDGHDLAALARARVANLRAAARRWT